MCFNVISKVGIEFVIVYLVYLWMGMLIDKMLCWMGMLKDK